MDRSILKQYLSGFQTVSRPSFFLENSMALGNLPQNISYNGLLYTYNLQENAFINQFGHKIDPSQAPVFVTEALAFTQQVPAAIMDLSSNAGDSRSRAVDDNPPPPEDTKAFSDPLFPTTENDIVWSYPYTEVSAFNVSYATNPNGPFVTLDTITNTEVQFYTHSGVTPGATYYYKVSAIKGSNITDGGVITFQTAGSTLPPVGVTAPAGLTTYSIASTSIGITWQDNSNNEQGFYVYRAEGNSAQPFTIIRGTGPNINYVLLQRLLGGTTYSFKIAAYGTGSTSGFSNTITVKTLPALPTAPTKLSVVALGTASIRMSWTDATGEDFYNIDRSTNGVNYVFGATAAAGATTYTLTGLSAATLYYVRINAQNAGGTSSYATGSATTEGIDLGF